MAISSFNLSDLDGSNGFVINGVDNYDSSGISVSSAGDVNGDGFDDVIIGAPGAEPGTSYYYGNYGNQGESYVVFGSSEGFATGLELADLDGSNGFVINGINNDDISGSSVSSAGDFNGDGISDLIIGARYADPNGNSRAGESYLVFGSSEGFTANLNLSDLDGSNGFVINGINNNDRSGFSVSSAGDFNGDGFDDVIIGARYAEPGTSYYYGYQGESYVVFGSSEGFATSLELADLDGSNGFVINGINNDDISGSSVSSAGDFNGDGFDDVIIGAQNADPNGNSLAGESYLVFGSSEGFTANLNLSDLDGSNGFVINGINNDDISGFSVSSAGDFNGDGFDDVIIGALNADPNGNSSAGESYLVFGSSEGFTANLDLSDLDGSNGFVINGINNDDNSGFSVSSAGDFNGDGFDDVIIGAQNADPNGNSSAGESYLVFGSSEGFTANLDLSDLDGSNGFVINGIDPSDDSGDSVSSAGDFNGDGISDLIIGAPGADANGNSSAGESYLVFGIVPLELIGTAEDDLLTGANGDDSISGLGGDDLLRGEAGNDQINGGTGSDLIIAGRGNDTVEGEAGNDQINGNTGNDNLAGNEGKDNIFGGNGNDNLSGGAGRDRLLGELGNDTLKGSTGRDFILGGNGNDSLNGGTEDDRLLGESGNDTLNGNTGSNSALGGDANDSLSGGNGRDSLLGESGNDTLKGNAGNDLLKGGEGNDFLRGGQQFDRLFGGTGDDNLGGGSQADTLTGGLGNDFLNGEAGNDLLIGVSITAPDSKFGAGETDTLTGGSQSDTFVLGDETSVYYSDGNSATAGESDFALITDFDPSQDAIQLQGTAEFYNLDFFPSGAGTVDARLIFDPGVAATGELIAILQEVSPELSINDPAFTFV